MRVVEQKDVDILFQLILRRLLAYIFDIGFLYALLGGGLQTLTGRIFGFPDLELLSQSPLKLEGWVLLSISLPTWLYFIISDLHGGATLGKRLFGLRTRTTTGDRIGIKQALLRTALKLLPWELTHFSILVPNPLWNPGAEAAVSQMIGITAANLLLLLYLAILVIRQGQRSLHDIAAGTLVTQPSQ